MQKDSVSYFSFKSTATTTEIFTPSGKSFVATGLGFDRAAHVTAQMLASEYSDALNEVFGGLLPEHLPNGISQNEDKVVFNKFIGMLNLNHFMKCAGYRIDEIVDLSPAGNRKLIALAIYPIQPNSQ